ncbi:MAG: glycosyltransferase family 2 protein [Desulfatibacillaceae bacterium]
MPEDEQVAREATAPYRLGKLVVVVPAYNEEESIVGTVEGLRGVGPVLREATGLDMSVYVVDDGSSDATRERAIGAGADRVLRHRTNLGLGAAVRTGLAAARNDGAAVAIKFDADLQHDPDDIVALVEPILADEADVVYGNRWEAMEYTMPVVRRAGNVVFTTLMRRLTGWPLKDSQPGILAVSEAYLRVFFLPGDYNYTQQILLDARLKGMRFAHVPVRFQKRTTGASFVSFRYPARVLPQIIMVLVGIRPMMIFGTVGLLFLLLGGAVFCAELAMYLMGDAPKPVVHVNLVLGSALFGLQTLFFGLLAQLIVNTRRRE